MRARALALPIAAAVLLAGCSSAPAGPARLSRPPSGPQLGAVLPAPGPSRPPGCPRGSQVSQNLPVAAGPRAVHLQTRWLRVGEAPVGLALTSNGSRLIVADSNRFLAPGRSASLAVIDTAAALSGRPALLGYLPSGRFPRDISGADGGQLLVANYLSGQLETVQSADLP
jgi:hypothetical protein